jgi:hypothetical protein
MRYRLVRSLSASLRHFCAALAKAVITSAVFGACVVIVMHYMGVPVPTPHELLKNFSGLSKLARILS